jgi:hypothetical protein
LISLSLSLSPSYSQWLINNDNPLVQKKIFT